jgi:hypothetical protein
MGINTYVHAQCNGNAPIINTFSPNTGFIGSTVTITGANFDPIPSSNQVYFGATQATVLTASFGVLTVQVPVGASTAPIAVKNGCNLIAYSSVSFNGIFCPTPITSSTYNNTAFNLTGVNGAYNMLAQDMDLDGKPDVVSVNGGVTVARNVSVPGTLSFTAHNFGGGGSSVSTADFDGDGKRDLFTTSYILRNTSTGPGNINFAITYLGSLVSPFPGGYQANVGDFNNDGKVDLVLDNAGGTMYFYRNTSTGPGSISFAFSNTVTVNFRSTGVQCADADGDGKTDVLATQGDGNRMIALRNTTTAGATTFSFGSLQAFNTGGAYPYRCQIADFDKDGRIDLTTVNYNSPGNTVNTAVFRNTSSAGTISFATPNTFSGPQNNYRVGVGDVNGDGLPDIVTKSLAVVAFAVYPNTSSGSGNIAFAPRFDYPSAAAAEVSGIVIGDLDGDFVPDIATSGTNSNTIRFHRNTSAQVDNTPPTALCKNITVALSPSGTVTVTPQMIDNGSGDACGIGSLQINNSTSVTFTCADIGNNTVTLKVTDKAGNVTTCTATVNVAPAAIIVSGQTTVCQGQTVTMNANQGDSYQWYNNGVLIPGATSQTYVATVSGEYTVTVTNAGGCSGTSSATSVTVNNNPTVSTNPSGNASLCPPGGTLTITASLSSIYQWKLNGNNISGATQQSLTVNAAGSYSVQVIDLFGCSATSDPIVVNATDNVPPVAKCKNVTVALDANESASVSVADINNGSTDNCGIASISLAGTTSYNCSHVGQTIQVTLFVKDNSGNESSCVANVTVTDPNSYCNAAPVAVCQALTLSADGNCEGNATATAFDGGSTDADGDPLTFTVVPAGPYLIGTTTVVVTVTDPMGASSSCTTTITVTDNTPPIITCPANITVNNDQGICGAVVNYNQPVAFDNCGGGTVLPVSIPGYTYKGTFNGHAYFVSDDMVRPEAAHTAATALGGYLATIGSAAENSFVSAMRPGENMWIGFTDRDNEGTYNWVNNEPISYTNWSANEPNNAGNEDWAVINWGSDGWWNDWAYDALAYYVVEFETGSIPATLVSGSASGTVFPVGTTTVTYSATDGSGNTVTCSFDVTVVDNEAPVIACPANQTIDLNSTCKATLPDYTSMLSANDNCTATASLNVTQSPAPGTSISGTGNMTVTFTVTDAAGNSSSCSMTVTKKDVTPPAITCPANRLLSLGSNCSLSLTNYTTTTFLTVTDNCNARSALTIVQSPAPGTVLTGIGTTTVTITVTDPSGNSSNCSFTVTTRDASTPVVTCPAAQTLNLGADCSTPLPDYTALLNATDNCTPASALVKTQTPAAGTIVSGVGSMIVVLRVTDASNNTRTCSLTVNKKDVTLPTLICQDITVANEAGQCGASVNFNIDASDACGPTILSVVPGFDGDISDLNFDNATSATFSPVITDQLSFSSGLAHAHPGPVTVFIDVHNATTNTWTQVFSQVVTSSQLNLNTLQINFPMQSVDGVRLRSNPGQNQTFHIQSTTTLLFTTQLNVVTSHASGSFFPVGNTTVTTVATDGSGNVSTCSFTVTVNDTEAPAAVCKNVTITLANGSASITPQMIDGGSTDNCGIAGLSVSKSNFSCADIGDNTIALTVTDIHGNTSTCTATVTVVGEIPTCSIASVPSSNTYTGGVSTNLYLGYGAQSTTLQLSVPASGAPYTFQWSGNGTLSSTSVQSPVFAPTAAGVYTFTVFITNQYGCTTTCTITICVMDIRVLSSNGSWDGKKVYICHIPPGNPGNAQTLEVSVNAVPAHIGPLGHATDRLGKCTQTPCGSTMTKAPVAVDVRVAEELSVKLSPNPTSKLFVLQVMSSDNKTPVMIRVMDGHGRMIETMKGSVEQLFRFGGNYISGTYFIEVMQGEKKKVVQGIKVN